MNNELVGFSTDIDAQEPENLALKDIIDEIRNCTLQDDIDSIRKSTCNDEQKDLKKALPIFYPSIIFKEDAVTKGFDGVQSTTSMFQFDVDVGPQNDKWTYDLALKEVLTLKPIYAFKSPKNGIKFAIASNAKIAAYDKPLFKAQFAEVYKWVQEKCPSSVFDEATTSASLGCYFSADKDVYYEPDTHTVFDVSTVTVSVVEPIKKKSFTDDVIQFDISILAQCLSSLGYLGYTDRFTKIDALAMKTWGSECISELATHWSSFGECNTSYDKFIKQYEKYLSSGEVYDGDFGIVLATCLIKKTDGIKYDIETMIPTLQKIGFVGKSDRIVLNKACLKTFGKNKAIPLLAAYWSAFEESEKTEEEIIRGLKRYKLDDQKTGFEGVLKRADKKKKQGDDFEQWVDWNEEGDRPLNTDDNLKVLLNNNNITCRYNRMTKAREVIIPGMCPQADFIDPNVQVTAIGVMATRCGFPTNKIPDLLDLVASKEKFHPVVDWIKEGGKWDGQDRFSELLNGLECSTESEKVKRLYITRWLMTAVHNLKCNKGYSSQGVLVFGGKQGIGKTTWIENLLPKKLNAIATGLSLTVGDKDSESLAISHFLCELGELEATFRKSDIAALKSFLTKNVDALRMPYARVSVPMPRQTIFFGTVNENEYLTDTTGNRRYWGLSVLNIKRDQNIDTHQLWKQLVHMYLKGEPFLMSEEENQRVNIENCEFERSTPIEEKLLSIFQPSEKGLFYSATELLERIDWLKPTKNDRNDITAALKKHHFKTSKRVINGIRKVGWNVEPVDQNPKVKTKKNTDDWR